MKKGTNNFKKFIGIDISKKTLDYCILDLESKVIKQDKIENTSVSLNSFLKELNKQKIDLEETIFCLENTGIYGYILLTDLSKVNANIWFVSPIEITKSKGMIRGKDDKKDAKVIANYALTHSYKFRQYNMPAKDLQKLKLLQTLRENYVDVLKNLESLNEVNDFLAKDITKVSKKINETMIANTEKAIVQIEKEIEALFSINEELNNQRKLITSIPGIGKNTALYLILCSNQFKNFSEWRKLACYSGIVPFDYSSGTSIKGRKKVNHMADKKLKSLLYMCAMSAITHNKEMKQYYHKKKEEGKHNMLILNNVKSKLLARVFAVINRNEPYVETQKWAA
jgi:transposase